MRVARLLIGLLAACVFLRTLSPPVDFDLWFNLRMGQEIAETHTIPHYSSYLGSANTFEAPYAVNDEWAFCWLSWQIYQHAGLPGLAVAKSLLLAVLAVVLCLGCRQAKLAGWAMVILVVAELFMVRGRFMFRPQLLTDVFLALQSLLILRQPKRFPWIAFGLYVVWTNFHAGMAAGIAVLGAVWVGSRFGKKEGLVLLAAVIGSLMRPGSWRIYQYLFLHVGGGRMTEMMQNNLEWLPIGPGDFLGAPGLFILLMLVGFGLALRRRSLVPGHLIACLGLLWTAARHNRALGELGAGTTAFIARNWSPVLPESRPANLLIALVLAGVLCLGPGTSDWNRTEFPRDTYPEGAVRYLGQHPVQGTLFNSYHFGGFLVFRHAPAMVHGMTPTYPNQVVFDYVSMLEEPARQQELIDKYSIGAFLLHYAEPGEAHNLLVRRLAQDPDWSLVYFDDVCMLYVPRTEHAYRAVNPGLEDPFTGALEAARAELEARLREDPGIVLAWSLLGQLELRERHWAEAEKAFTAALTLYENDLNARLGRAQARANLGDAGGALDDLKHAVAFRPNSPVAHYNLAVLYHNQNMQSEARKEAEKAARLNFPPAEKLLEKL